MINKIKGLISEKGGIGKFIRYVLVGGSAVIVDFAVFEILLLLIGADTKIEIFSYNIEP